MFMPPKYILLRLISSLLLIFGLIGMIGSVYFYIEMYPQIYQNASSLSSQLLLASQNLETLTNQKLLIGGLSTQINLTITNLNQLNLGVLQTAQQFTSLGSDFNICLFSLCPFSSVSNLFYNLSSTASSASKTVSAATTGLSSLTSLTVGDVLTPQQSSMLNAASVELNGLANILNKAVTFSPYLLLYIFSFNLMFFITGIGIWLVTSELKRFSIDIKKKRR